MRAKLVQQTYRGFTRGGDPAAAMGVGTRVKIGEWLDLMSVYGYTVNDDLTVDVDGDVFLDAGNVIINPRFSRFPGYVRFGSIKGDFYCDGNDMVSLEGGPRMVGGDFYCGHNELTSLKGCPKRVGNDFSCSHNELTSLEGCPRTVGGNFYCRTGNGKKFTEKEVEMVCRVAGAIFCK